MFLAQLIRLRQAIARIDLFSVFSPAWFGMCTVDCDRFLTAPKNFDGSRKSA